MDSSKVTPPSPLAEAPIEEKRKASVIEGITKLAAVVGSLVAVGQATSTWIDGVYKAKAEQEKTVREIKLADIKEKSALAESYLKLVLSKETPIDGRAILLSALGELEGGLSKAVAATHGARKAATAVVTSTKQ